MGPLASTFSRSPSTSTITDKDEKSQSIAGSVTPTNEGAIRKSNSNRYILVSSNACDADLLVLTLLSSIRGHVTGSRRKAAEAGNSHRHTT